MGPELVDWALGLLVDISFSLYWFYLACWQFLCNTTAFKESGTGLLHFDPQFTNFLTGREPRFGVSPQHQNYFVHSPSGVFVSPAHLHGAPIATDPCQANMVLSYPTSLFISISSSPNPTAIDVGLKLHSLPI